MENFEEKNLLPSEQQSESEASDELNNEELEAVDGGGILGAALGGVIGGAAGFITTGSLDGAKGGATAGIAVGGLLPEP